MDKPKHFDFVIIGAGLAGVSAMEGIREMDNKGSILLINAEKDLPYHRPPLTKDLWFGKKKINEIFIHESKFYDDSGISLLSDTKVTTLDLNKKILVDEQGTQYGFNKALIATGGIPRKLSIPGNDLEGVYYFRTLNDFQRLHSSISEGKKVVVVGGGFIGSELAAALNANKADVTMIFPSPYLCHRVFPDSLGQAIQEHYIERGVNILTQDKPASIQKQSDKFIINTTNGKQIESDIVIIGAGLMPDLTLAKNAGLMTDNGIVVNECLETSHTDVYAAGDNAFFPYKSLGKSMRVEHWDNALNQGKLAGWNMAGAKDEYTYEPYFFSDLFEFGYEAVGEVDSSLDIFADWQTENQTGVIYYLKDSKVRGVMMCNVWNKVDVAREIIRQDEQVNVSDLRGAIK